MNSTNLYDAGDIRFADLRNKNSFDFRRLWILYNTAFPHDERRSLLEQELVMKDPRYHFAAILHRGTTVGLLAYWLLHEMFFIEHFAINPECRSAGIGGKVINQLQYYADRKIVLDVEPKNESVDTERRVHFYEKHGFRYSPKPVVLPSYRFAKPVASHLMTWSPNKVFHTQKQIVENIRRCVYHIPQ
ncbi:MAG: GNAT family N-acetyltransferase [Lentisphaerae bacterium]|jgi:ribosomal protein S18 acetylase RimI-like enzyme|nr:GNAT family N-acetyltransferase [Lentisphaerota bacterium]